MNIIVITKCDSFHGVKIQHKKVFVKSFLRKNLLLITSMI